MVGVLAVALIVSGALAVVTGPQAGAMTVRPSATPAFAGDSGDPDVVYSGGTYFAFSTGTPLGNHIQALVSSSPSSGYGSYTGESYGSTALASTPVMADDQHPDLAGGVLLGRSLADVLRRRREPECQRHRARLYFGSCRWDHAVAL